MYNERRDAIIGRQMVPRFERRRNLHPLNVLIDAEPTKARAEMVRAYKAGGYTHDGAAQHLEVAESTFIRWVKKLDMWTELDRIRRQAEHDGAVLPSRRPARKLA